MVRQQDTCESLSYLTGKKVDNMGVGGWVTWVKEKDKVVDGENSGDNTFTTRTDRHLQTDRHRPGGGD